MSDCSVWIKCSEELPPCDGKYDVTNLTSLGSQGVLEYDGYGFLYDGHYAEPSYWRECKNKEKTYGKVVK